MQRTKYSTDEKINLIVECKEQGVTFQEFAKQKDIPVQNLYNWQRNHADKIAERLKAGDTKAKIIAALVQEILKTKNNTIQEEEERLITEIARLKYNKGEYPNEALLNAVRDGMLAKCSDGESLISILIQEHAILVFQESDKDEYGCNIHFKA